MDTDDLILIGKITKIRGLKGQLKVYPLTDFPEQFSHLDSVLIRFGDSWESFTVSEVMFHGRNIFLKFEGIDNHEKANELVGTEIYMERQRRMVLPQDSFYFEEIEGFQVISTAGERVGVLVDIHHFPASDVLVIDRDGEEALIPFVKPLVPEIDLEGRTIKVADMPSLWES